MRVALVCVTNHNYGSLLQTYALQEVVKGIGCKTVIIKYHEPYSSKLKRCTDIEYLVTRLRMIRKKFANKRISAKLRIRYEAFERFINSRLDMSKSFNSLHSMSPFCQNFDIVLLGSDQVWHPMNILMNYFTLNFVPDKITKAAYAPSFGVSSIPHKYIKAYKAFMPRFSYLSSRETQGVELIKVLSGRNAVLVCDPTMLISADEWRLKMPTEEKVHGKYIFCYFIGNNIKQRQKVKDFSKRTGLKIVAILHVDEYISTDDDYCDEALYDITPLDFIKLIDNASFIFTDSFHASVFSILFHKRFWVFDRFESDKRHSTSSRILSLLSIAGLTKQYVHSSDNFNPDYNLENDFDVVDNKIECLKKKSIAYLMSFLHE